MIWILRRCADMEEKYVLEEKIIIPKDYLETTEEELQKKIDEQLIKDGKKQDKISNGHQLLAGALNFVYSFRTENMV